MSDDTKRQQFWLVWREGGGDPTYKHYSMDAAITEAERLARNHHGSMFWVMECIGGARKRDVDWVSISDDGEIPF